MFLILVQVVVATLLIACILLQVQGSGLSSVFGGGGEFYRSRRSIERLLLWATIALSFIFAIMSVVLLFPR